MNDSASGPIEFQLTALDVPRLDTVEQGNGRRHSAGPGKSLALITYLALSPRHSCTRDALCDLLWGDRQLSQSRPLLRQTLWLIRTQIHESIIHVSGEIVSLSGTVKSDVEAFVTAIQDDDLRRAVHLYKCDFFAGYGAPGAGRFEEWANSERIRLRGLFLSAAETLARQALNSGHFQDAVALAHRMREIDPHGQTSWRLRLEARAASGDTIGARADADQLEDWLRTEEWEPDPETSAAIRAARKPTTLNGPSAQSDDFVTELVGREKEFSLIHDAWLSTKSGGSRFIHISGDSGLGKTRLMQDIIARIRASRGRARYVRANLAEQAISFSFASAIVEALASLSGAAGIAPSAARTIVSLNPKLSSQYAISDASERLEPLRVGLAILELIAAVSDEKAIAIVLDDLQWSDPYSREALTVVSSRLSEEKAFVLSSARTHYSAGSLRPESPVLPLKRLTSSEVTTLLTSLGRLPDAETAEQISGAFWRATDGVPLRLLEAIRFCVDSGLLIRSGEEWSCPQPDRLVASLHASATLERRFSTLSVEERELIGLIALCGMPTPRTLVIAAGSQSQQAAVATIASLERHGLAVVEDELWSLAHDSVAETFRATADPATVARLHSRLGIALSASQEEFWRRRSIPHLAAVGDWNYAARVASPFLRAGSWKSTGVRQAIAALSGFPGDEAVSKIFFALPFRVRHPRIGQQLAVAGVFGTVTILSLVALRGSSPKPGPVLVSITRTPDGNTDFGEAALDMKTWDVSSPLSFHSVRSISGWFGDRFDHATPRPGTNSWAVYSVYPDSGEGEIDLFDITGKRTRLTHSAHDDRPMSFSPDGNQLLFITSRWSPNGWPDVAILDLRTGRTKRLTPGESKYEGPSWSPDGTRIAYNVQGRFCVADSDGSRVHCESVPGWKTVWAQGWLDAHHLFISGNHGSLADAIAIFDIDRRALTNADFPARTNIVIDPSGSWLLSNRISDGEIYHKISPAARYDLAKVVPADSGRLPAFTFLLPNLSNSYLDKLAIAGPHEPLAVNVPHRLTAVGWTREKNPTVPAVARWRSLTPDVAVIDSFGVLLASKPGLAVIELSAGGWRKAVDTLTIEAATSSTLVQESWNTGVNERWRIFGMPSPVLVRAHDTVAFFNNGDGAFFSGAHMKRTFNARDGLAMDLEVSTPINGTQWQLLMAALQPVTPDDRVNDWDHRTGYITSFSDDQTGCWFAYPSGEGKGLTTRAPWHKSMLIALNNPAFRIDDGSWYRLRIQIFPDGRCGIAINNQAVEITAGTGAIRSRVMPILQGMSVRTKVLVGPVKIISGVPADVDWTKLAFDGYLWLRRSPSSSFHAELQH